MQYFIHQYPSFIHSKTRSTKIAKQLTLCGIMSWQNGILNYFSIGLYFIFKNILTISTCEWSMSYNYEISQHINSFKMSPHPHGIF